MSAEVMLVAQPEPDDVLGNIAAIKAIIVGWVDLADRGTCFLTGNDDGVYCLHHEDGEVFYETTADGLSEMLIFVKEVNASDLCRQRSEGINGPSTTNSPSQPLSPDAACEDDEDDDDDDIGPPNDVPGTIAAIKAIIADWLSVASDSKCSLVVVGGVCWLQFDDNGDAPLYQTTLDRLPEMLIWAKEFDAALDRRQQAEAAAEGINGTTSTINSPSSPRGRPLSPEVTERRRRITEMAERFQPAGIRQLYYQAEVAGLVEKTHSGYRKVAHDILVLRQRGDIDYGWISDNSRWMRKSGSYRGIDHFLNLTINTYRRNLWHDAPIYCEVWIEKDGLAGTIMSETDPYDVPLMVARGFSSETYLYEAAQAITHRGKPAYIYAFFDHDPSGKWSSKHIERQLRGFAPGAEIHFELVAVTKEQIEKWDLPTRETKRGANRHAKGFEGDSCELDSIPPDKLRDLVRECIERHIDQDRLAILRTAEESEREALKMFAQSWRPAR